MKQKFLVSITLIFILALPQGTLAANKIDPAFNPSKLIDDKVFSDTQTFGGAAGIQKFLESKNSILANTTPSFLAKLKEPQMSILKEGLEDPQPKLGKLRTAAELIWDAAQSSGLNPQVILVTLNKEQSLITGHQTSSPDQVQRALDHAMGFGCPDSGGCDSAFVGFYFQLFGNLDAEANRYLGSAKSLMRSFTTPGGRGPAVNGVPAKVGDSITLGNTLGGYDGVQSQQTVVLSNAATAALYRYTPHVFNGNYNFWRFFNTWFRYANGTLLKSGKKTTAVYIIQNGAKQLVPEFVAKARGLNIGSALVVSPTELDSYPTEKVYGPADNTIISVDGKLYVFIANVKHPASAFVITQRGLNANNAITVSATEAKVFTDGPQLTPSNGTVLKGDNSAAIYLVDNGSLRLFSPFTFGQRNVAKQVKTAPQAEVDSYPKAGWVAPLDGTLVKAASSGTVYIVEGSVLRPLTGELFRNRGLSFKNIVVLSDEEFAGLPMGEFAAPKENTYFQSPSGLYLYKDGTTHKISSFVAAQKKLTPDFTFGGEADRWPSGVPIMPRENTVVKGDKSQAVYLVQTGQLRLMTFEAFKARGVTQKQIMLLPQAEVDAYPKGDTLTK